MKTQERIDFLMSQYDGRPLTGKISEKPEHWLTIVEPKKEEEIMGELISMDGRRLGTGTKITGGGDWLTNLKVGTVFVCELANDAGMPTIIQQEYALERKDGDSYLLMANLNEPVVHARVNPERFCKYYRLVAVLFEPKEEQENASY